MLLVESGLGPAAFGKWEASQLIVADNSVQLEQKIFVELVKKTICPLILAVHDEE